jgi:cytochrome c556
MFLKVKHIKKMGLLFFMTILFTLCEPYTTAVAVEKKKEEDPKKKEMQELMKKIDHWYKKSQERMGYYFLTESDWEVFLKAGETISKLSDVVLQKFVPPDDKIYLKETKDMQKHAADMAQAANERYTGAYEDIQYSFGRLRNTCKNCHNHLGIQIYTELYPGEASKESH